jgi:hypothetical protein
MKIHTVEEMLSDKWTDEELAQHAREAQGVAWMFYSTPPEGHPCPNAAGDWWARRAAWFWELSAQ